MNFRRIQWIFLIAFIAIDIFLLISWQQSDATVKETSPRSANSATTILREMRGDGITFSTLSNKEAQGYYVSGKTGLARLKTGAQNLTYQEYRFTSTEMTSTLHQTLVINPKSPQTQLNRFIKSGANVTAGNDYVYSAELSRVAANEVVYVQVVPSGTIMAPSGQLRFRVGDKNQVIGYTQSYVSNVEPLREKTTTISQQKALIWLYQYNELPNNSRVVWSRLAYSRLLRVSDNNVYVPTWFIALRSKSTNNVVIKRVNAFTGAVMKSTDSTTAVTNGAINSRASSDNAQSPTVDQSNVDVSSAGN